MRPKNSKDTYGLVAVVLHWVVAAAVFGLFALGLWMTSLTYYHPWYRSGPWWHKGLGAVLLVLVLLRLAWRVASPRLGHPRGAGSWELRLAGLTHWLAYLFMLVLPVSGYLISTANGRALEVFDSFVIPALPSGIDRQEDLAGSVHLGLAVALIGLVILHALAALKHHFIHRDRTLLRMLGR